MGGKNNALFDLIAEQEQQPTIGILSDSDTYLIVTRVRGTAGHLEDAIERDLGDGANGHGV